MSIGLTFTGKVRKPAHLIQTAQNLAKERYYGFYKWEAPEKGEAGLNISLCPLDGIVRLSWKKEGGLFGQWSVEGQCMTTPGGPGLHKAAVEVLDGLGLKHLRVEDETDYFTHRDFEKMRQEHFYPWLTTLIEMCGQQKDELNNIRICWDMDSYLPEDIPGTVVTPMGRFSLKWLKQTLDSSGIEALAERFFLWFHPGKRDALYDRQIALNLLWERCYYAPSSRDPEDESINQTICDNLEVAAKLDPALPLPRKAYAEICKLARRAPALPDGPELEEEFLPGYRKGLVTYAVGPMQLVLPGCYRFEWEEWDENNGCHRWEDESSLSPIWRVNGYRMRQGSAAFTPVLKDDSGLTEHAIKDGAIRYGWRELAEEHAWQVRAEVITGPSLFVITVTYLEPEDRADIVELLEKITIQTGDVKKQTIQAHT